MASSSIRPVSSFDIQLNQLNPRVLSGYDARVSTEKDIDKIIEFYSPPEGLPSGVVRRRNEVLADAATKQDVFLVELKKNIVWASATYLMDGGARIDPFFTAEGKLEEKRVTRQLGSVLKRNDPLSRWLSIVTLFGGSELNAFFRAFERPFDTLVCNVHQDNQITAARITNMPSIRDRQTPKDRQMMAAPLEWERVRATTILKNADDALMVSPGNKTPTDWYWDSVHRLPRIAQYFLIAALELSKGSKIQWDQSILRNSYGDKARINLEQLPFLKMTEIIGLYPDLLPGFGELNVSWGASRLRIEPLLKDNPSDPYGLMRDLKAVNPYYPKRPKRGKDIANGNKNTGSGSTEAQAVPA